ncbi:hypothetical protein [Burkholderia sp. Bp8963]|uniref:hypothetical protein n=1 Tax=Burkholderia sp. Bp8963 TaxID=2184547 RepID=UPI000F59F121|nr:hypothetical protein [Burkholderia sp. Bp8963]
MSSLLDGAARKKSTSPADSWRVRQPARADVRAARYASRPDPAKTMLVDRKQSSGYAGAVGSAPGAAVMIPCGASSLPLDLTIMGMLILTMSAVQAALFGNPT